MRTMIKTALALVTAVLLMGCNNNNGVIGPQCRVTTKLGQVYYTGPVTNYNGLVYFHTLNLTNPIEMTTTKDVVVELINY